MTEGESDETTKPVVGACNHVDGAGETLIENYEHLSMCSSCGRILWQLQDPDVQWGMIP